MAFDSDIKNLKLTDTEEAVPNTKLDPKEVFPSLFAMCGSAGAILLVRVSRLCIKFSSLLKSNSKFKNFFLSADRKWRFCVC